MGKALECYRSLSFRRKFSLVFGLVAFTTGLVVESSLGIALATVLILLSAINEKDLS